MKNVKNSTTRASGPWRSKEALSCQYVKIDFGSVTIPSRLTWNCDLSFFPIESDSKDFTQNIQRAIQQNLFQVEMIKNEKVMNFFPRVIGIFEVDAF